MLETKSDFSTKMGDIEEKFSRFQQYLLRKISFFLMSGLTQLLNMEAFGQILVLLVFILG